MNKITPKIYKEGHAVYFNIEIKVNAVSNEGRCRGLSEFRSGRPLTSLIHIK